MIQEFSRLGKGKFFQITAKAKQLQVSYTSW